MDNRYTDVTVQKVNDWLDDCNLQRKQKVLVQRFLFMRSLGLITTMTREKKPRSEVIIQWFELVLSETKKADIDQLNFAQILLRKKTPSNHSHFLTMSGWKQFFYALVDLIQCAQDQI